MIRYLIPFVGFIVEVLAGRYQDNVPATKLSHPAVLSLDSGRGMVSTTLYPGHGLRVQDPTDNLICRYLLNEDYTAFFIPKQKMKALKQTHLVKFINVDDNNLYKKRPWVVLLKTNQLPVPMDGFREVYLRPLGTTKTWQLDAYTVKTSDDDYDDTEEVLPAPTPNFQSLCAGPENRRPSPFLYSFPPTANSYPITAYYSLQDFNPSSVVNK